MQGKPALSMEKRYESQRNPKYVVDKPCNIYRLRGNLMIIIGFPRNLWILQGFPTTGKTCEEPVMPCKHLQCILSIMKECNCFLLKYYFCFFKMMLSLVDCFDEEWNLIKFLFLPYVFHCQKLEQEFSPCWICNDLEVNRVCKNPKIGCSPKNTKCCLTEIVKVLSTKPL